MQNALVAQLGIVSIMHGQNHRFTLRLSGVIYHWADIMASCRSHIGITEAGAWPAH